jgi:hypothetical protein
MGVLLIEFVLNPAHGKFNDQRENKPGKYLKKQVNQKNNKKKSEKAHWP